MIFPITFSKGSPSFSYMAIKKKGSITVTIRMAAILDPTPFRVRKYNGTPTTAAMLKKISWRFVKFSATLVLTCVRSFGTGTYAIIVSSSFFQIFILMFT